MSIRLTKIDAAERQLREAIRLFFDERDPVAVQVLTSGADQVISDLGRKAGKPCSIVESGLIRPGKEKEVLRILNAPWNFAKHADRDPDAVFEFNPESNLFHIVAVLGAYKTLTGQDLNPEGAVMGMFASAHHPHLFLDSPHKQMLESFSAVHGVMTIANGAALIRQFCSNKATSGSRGAPNGG